MPYIVQEKRIALQKAIADLVKELKELGVEERAGNLNYTFSTILNEMYPINKYRELNDLMGVLTCIQQEMYRKRIGPYEDTAVEKNGDINWPTTNKDYK